MTNSLLKSTEGSTAPTTFESWLEVISLVLKSFQEIQKLLALNGKKSLLIQHKIKGTVKKIMIICRTFS